MKKLMFALALAASFAATAADAKKDAAPAPAAKAAPAPKAQEAKEVPEEEIEKDDAPLFWGFGNYGFYSGYQLYGSIVNTEPTLQGYLEGNVNLPFEVGALDDLGFFGIGMWNNSDLTGKRNASYRRAFNEFDFNIHWQKTFWFDDEKTVGLTYRSYVVWYYYPVTSGRHPANPVTFDWDHYIEITNPYLTPYINIVHEYARSDGNLLQFGVKKPWQITEQFSVTPFIEFVWRDRNYGWCFSNFGLDDRFEKQSAGLATMKLELDATYMFNQYIGVFAKVAYCQNIDPHMRESADVAGSDPEGDSYGPWNEFCWGGFGVCVNF